MLFQKKKFAARDEFVTKSRGEHCETHDCLRAKSELDRGLATEIIITITAGMMMTMRLPMPCGAGSSLYSIAVFPCFALDLALEHKPNFLGERKLF